MPQRKVPISQRLLDGTYKPSKHGPIPTGQTTGGAPVKPKSLKNEAARIWKDLTALLKGRAQASDGPMLANLCRWWARMDALQEKLDALEAGTVEFGRVIIQAGIATDKVTKMGQLFGLSPADRAKLGPATGAGGANANGAICWPADVLTRGRDAL